MKDLKAVVDIAKYLLPMGATAASVMGEIAVRLKEHSKTPHGSMVTWGEHKGHAVMDLTGKESWIVLNGSTCVPLTREYVAECVYAEKKFKVPQMKTYYYYMITFKDGGKSRVRVSEKQKKNLDRLCARPDTGNHA